MRYHIFKSYCIIKRRLLPLLVLSVLAQGCASNYQNKRLERYYPVVMNRNYQMPARVVQAIPEKEEQVDIKVEKPVVAKSLVTPVTVEKTVVQPVIKTAAAVETPTVEVKQPVELKKPATVTSVVIDDGGTMTRMRKLKHGDMITVGLYGIPNQIEVKESIDNFGSISLPLIDVIKIVGLGTSAAERKIRDAYINSGFYTDLSVVVMAMADEYFIRGEVKRVGNYELLGDRTLLQAITVAGGYTDYAKLSKVTILRLDEAPKVFDCHKIAKRRIADPLIHPGDIIIVPRRIFWK